MTRPCRLTYDRIDMMRAPWISRGRGRPARDRVAGDRVAGDLAPSRPRLPYWAEDWTIGPAKVWRPARILLWCCGVDRALLRTNAEALRYSGLGALVVAVAALGATTFTIFTAVVLGHFRWYLVPFGLAWGTLILLIDRAIVTEPHYWEREAGAALQIGPPIGETPPTLATAEMTAANGSNGSHRPGRGQASHARAVTAMKLPPDHAGWHLRGLVYTMRLLITLCIAYLVAETAMLLIFHPEVSQQLAQLHVSQFQQERTQEINAAIKQETGQLNTYRAQWNRAQASVASMKQQLNKDTAQAAAEKGGQTSGPDGPTSGLPGESGQWQADIVNVNQDRQQLQTLSQDAAQDESKYNNLSTELQAASQANPAALSALHVPDPAILRAGIFRDNGLNAQEHALDMFVAANRGDVLATAGPWVLRVLLIAIDLVPLGTKLLNRYTIYGRRLSERALVIRYHDMARDNAILRDIDQQAAIHTLHSQHDYEVEAERAGWRRSWRMNHMRFPE